MKQSELNLTGGAVFPLLIRFAIPLFFSNLLQACYNVADMVIVGRFVGSAGVAAVSNASTLCFIVTSIGIGLAVGGTVLAAKFRGAGNMQAEHNVVGTLFTIMALAALPVSFCSYTLSRQLFSRLAVPPEALDQACEYMKIQSFGTIFVFGYNAVGALLRGFGDSRRPLFFISIATVINIVLDLLFVGIMKMGTAGAAQATVTAQGSALLIALFFLKKQRFFAGYRPQNFLPDPIQTVGILKVGIPSMLQLVVINIAFLLVGGMFNQYGVTAAAAAGIGLKNLGAGKIARTAAAIRKGILLSLVTTGSTILIIQFFAESIIGYFDSDPEVIRSGVLYLRIFSSWSGLTYAVMYTCNAFATGTGAPSLAMFNAILEALLLRLPLCWFFGTHLEMGFTGICWGMALSTLPPAVIGAAYCKQGKWRSQSENY